jgi:hypothetical protein
MGDCDRLKHYISDYLENGLDPATQKEFDDALEKLPELKVMTNRARIMSSELKNLNYYSCSEDFQLKLREKIHTQPESVISKQNIVRYSFAFSVVIILFIVTFSMMNASDSPELNPLVPENSDFQIKTTDPVPNPLSGNKVKSLVNDDNGVAIKTRPVQNIVADSSRIYDKSGSRKDIPPIKQVDQKIKDTPPGNMR